MYVPPEKMRKKKKKELMMSSTLFVYMKNVPSDPVDGLR